MKAAPDGAAEIASAKSPATRAADLMSRLSAALISLFAAVTASAAPDERGLRVVRVYATAEHGAGAQSWGVVQDPRGVLYIGNLAGALEYDGAWWRVIPTANDSAVRSLAVGEGGRVAVGGYEELGLLGPDEHGVLRYQSLLGLLPAGLGRFAEVWAIHPVPSGFLYLTRKHALLYDGRSLRQVAAFVPGERITGFGVGGTFYLSRPAGLATVTPAGVKALPDAPFAGRPLQLMLATGTREVLAAVEGEGLVLWDPVSRAERPFSAAASRWLAEAGLTGGCRLADGRFAFTTRRRGVLLVMSDGEVDEVIDASSGLPDGDLGAPFSDRDGALWLTWDGGLVRVEASSPLSMLDARSGLRGSPVAVARHGGALYVATLSGLHVLEPGGSAGSQGARARPVTGLPDAWSLASVSGDLLVGTSRGVYRLDPGTPSVVKGTEPLTAYVLRPSAFDPSRVWVGFHEGIGSLRHRPEGWRFDGLLENVPAQVHSLVEPRPGVLFAGTILDGAVRVDTARGEIRRYAQKEVEVAWVGGEVVFTAHGIFRLDDAGERLVPHPLSRFATASAFALCEDARGAVWMNTRPVSVATPLPGGGYRFEDRLLAGMPSGDVQLIAAEPDGVVWLGSERGLARYDARLRPRGGSPGTPLVRRVTQGSAVFGGDALAAGEVAATGRLRFECAPATYDEGVLYQYRLDPADADWSAWTGDPYREYTNLWEGPYRFRVRTKGTSGDASGEAFFDLSVRPPWFRTPAAYLFYALAATGAAAGSLRIRHRTLQRRNEVLKARVAERTRELARTVEELDGTRRELEAKNAQLAQLSLKDPLTGIANRRRLEEALAEEWSRAHRLGSELAAILLDLDLFKSLNDALGHQEGDACLKRVSALLEASLRRTGDLAARYGGEEFVLLLPATSGPGALQLAERIRAGVEALAIPSPGVPGGRVTASLGVAAANPRAGGSAELLMAAADRALYAAKAAGRNRVRATTV